MHRGVRVRRHAAKLHWQVLVEHARNPVELLKRVRGLLKPDGTLFVVTPSLDLAYGRELSDRRDLTVAFSSAPSVTFTVDGASPGRDSVHVGLGLDAQIGRRVQVFAQLVTDQSRQSHANSAFLGARLAW